MAVRAGESGLGRGRGLNGFTINDAFRNIYPGLYAGSIYEMVDTEKSKDPFGALTK